MNTDEKKSGSSVKEKRIKNTVKLILILALFAGVYLYVNRLFLIKSEDGIEQFHAYYKQPKDSVDVLFVGSSHIFCHINTGILWEEQGISAFDLAGAEQPFWVSLYYIKEAMKTQDPKLVVLDITTPGVRPVEYQPENWVVTNHYGMKWDKNKWDALRANTLEESFERLLFPLSVLHGRYTDLTRDDFVDETNTVNYKGFDPREATTPFEEPRVMGIMERAPILEKEEKYLRMILEYAKDEDIPLLLVSSPYILTPEEQAKFNTIFDIADEYGVEYVDFNKLYRELDLDFSQDFQEILHLNRMGNAKYTSYLGKLLKERYDLPDHRGDAKYSSWDADANYQRQDNAGYFMKQINDPDEYSDLFLDNYGLMTADEGNYRKALPKTADADAARASKYFYANSDNYLIFLQIGNDVSQITEDEMARLMAIGMDESMLIPGNAVLLKSRECLFTSDEAEFRYVYKDAGRNLLFYRTESGESTEDGIPLYKTALKSLDGEYALVKEGISFMVYDTALHRVVDVR